MVDLIGSSFEQNLAYLSLSLIFSARDLLVLVLDWLTWVWGGRGTGWGIPWTASSVGAMLDTCTAVALRVGGTRHFTEFRGTRERC